MTKRVGCSKVVLWCGALCLIAFPELHAQTSVLTYRNDNGRTAQNLTETRLTPANVNSTTFGKLFNYPVDGRVDAQPLVVSALAIPNHGTPNVAFAATEHDSLYAFDATTGATYWQITLLKPGETSSDTRSCGQVSPEIGVTATPAIDLNAGPHGTIYVVAMSKDSGGGYHQRLHAVDITTGAEQFGGPVDIQATYPVTWSSIPNNIKSGRRC
jgi:outer membrane protein assembly factor BamB